MQSPNFYCRQPYYILQNATHQALPASPTFSYPFQQFNPYCASPISDFSRNQFYKPMPKDAACQTINYEATQLEKTIPFLSDSNLQMHNLNVKSPYSSPMAPEKDLENIPSVSMMDSISSTEVSPTKCELKKPCKKRNVWRPINSKLRSYVDSAGFHQHSRQEIVRNFHRLPNKVKKCKTSSPAPLQSYEKYPSRRANLSWSILDSISSQSAKEEVPKKSSQKKNISIVPTNSESEISMITSNSDYDDELDEFIQKTGRRWLANQTTATINSLCKEKHHLSSSEQIKKKDKTKGNEKFPAPIMSLWRQHEKCNKVTNIDLSSSPSLSSHEPEENDENRLLKYSRPNSKYNLGASNNDGLPSPSTAALVRRRERHKTAGTFYPPPKQTLEGKNSRAARHRPDRHSSKLSFSISPEEEDLEDIPSVSMMDSISSIEVSPIEGDLKKLSKKQTARHSDHDELLCSVGSTRLRNRQRQKIVQRWQHSPTTARKCTATPTVSGRANLSRSVLDSISSQSSEDKLEKKSSLRKQTARHSDHDELLCSVGSNRLRNRQRQKIVQRWQHSPTTARKCTATPTVSGRANLSRSVLDSISSQSSEDKLEKKSSLRKQTARHSDHDELLFSVGSNRLRNRQRQKIVQRWQHSPTTARKCTATPTVSGRANLSRSVLDSISSQSSEDKLEKKSSLRKKQSFSKKEYPPISVKSKFSSDKNDCYKLYLANGGVIDVRDLHKTRSGRLSIPRRDIWHRQNLVASSGGFRVKHGELSETFSSFIDD